MSQSIGPSATIGADRSNAIMAALPLISRIMIAAIFLFSGVSKIAAPAMTVGYIRSVGLPLPEVGLGLALLVEVGGGIALIAGYRTRLVAAVMALFTITTALVFHSNFADQNQFVHFFKNLAMAGGLLQIVAFGSGGFSLTYPSPFSRFLQHETVRAPSPVGSSAAALRLTVLKGSKAILSS